MPQLDEFVKRKPYGWEYRVAEIQSMAKGMGFDDAARTIKEVIEKHHGTSYYFIYEQEILSKFADLWRTTTLIRRHIRFQDIAQGLVQYGYEGTVC